MNIHLGDKPYVCLLCSKPHTSIAALCGHTRARHDMTVTEMRERVKNGEIIPDSGQRAKITFTLQSDLEHTDSEED
ncbi:hypothetical protein QYM36_012106 [Artemia franciscana]|uniref:C2H2-type domain-containing protein n=3 Tax=Artemia franciscana TaxID=6661 RepID=A0AA88HI99_ARTSF|nr:hypothetical protein QYM36_012106 [Artemia franciscana]